MVSQTNPLRTTRPNRIPPPASNTAADDRPGLTVITLPKHHEADWWTPDKEKAIRKRALEFGITSHMLKTQLQPDTRLVTLRWTTLTEREVYRRLEAIAAERGLKRTEASREKIKARGMFGSPKPLATDVDLRPGAIVSHPTGYVMYEVLEVEKHRLFVRIPDDHGCTLWINRHHTVVIRNGQPVEQAAPEATPDRTRPPLPRARKRKVDANDRLIARKPATPAGDDGTPPDDGKPSRADLERRYFYHLRNRAGVLYTTYENAVDVWIKACKRYNAAQEAGYAALEAYHRSRTPARLAAYVEALEAVQVEYEALTAIQARKDTAGRMADHLRAAIDAREAR